MRKRYPTIGVLRRVRIAILAILTGLLLFLSATASYAVWTLWFNATAEEYTWYIYPGETRLLDQAHAYLSASIAQVTTRNYQPWSGGDWAQATSQGSVWLEHAPMSDATNACRWELYDRGEHSDMECWFHALD